MRITFIRSGESAQEVGKPNLAFKVGDVMESPDDLSNAVAERLVKYEWATETPAEDGDSKDAGTAEASNEPAPETRPRRRGIRKKREAGSE